jgi:23S rRNA (cytidine1920-2'-O)/16S rRNA (cytidine1409-2'-O)-methyltransferase
MQLEGKVSQQRASVTVTKQNSGQQSADLIRPEPALMRLDELLVLRGLAESRSQAQRLLMAGQVKVAGQVVDKAGKQVAADVAVEVKSRLPYVSRGGLKLEAALDAFGLDPAGRICADIGASTGGFTDCLLQRGAARIYAIDVGYGQLAWSLRTDRRVVVVERVNVRFLEELPERMGLVTVDVSFISLRLVLPRVATMLVPSGQTIALIKPQFEVGKKLVGKGGVVRDPQLHRLAIEQVLTAAENIGFATLGLIRSPIRGPAGNVEFLTLLQHGGSASDPALVARWLDACLAGG